MSYTKQVTCSKGLQVSFAVRGHNNERKTYGKDQKENTFGFSVSDSKLWL